MNKPRFITIGSPSDATGASKTIIMRNAGNGIVLMAHENNALLQGLHEFGQYFGENMLFSHAESKAKKGTYWHLKAQEFLQRFNDCTAAEVIFAAYMVARAKIVKVVRVEKNTDFEPCMFLAHFGDNEWDYYCDGGEWNIFKVLLTGFGSLDPKNHGLKTHKEVFDYVMSLGVEKQLELTYERKYQIWDILFSKMVLEQLVKEFYNLRVLEDGKI